MNETNIPEETQKFGIPTAPLPPAAPLKHPQRQLQGSGEWNCPILSEKTIDANTAGSPAFVLCRGVDQRLPKGQHSILDPLCPAYLKGCCGCNFSTKRCYYVEKSLSVPDPIANICGHSYCPPVDFKEPPKGCHICEPILRDRLANLLEDRKAMLRLAVITKESLDTALDIGDEEEEEEPGNDSVGDEMNALAPATKKELLMTQCKDMLLKLRPPK